MLAMAPPLRFVPLVASLAIILGSAPAAAQPTATNQPGFSIERLLTPPGSGVFFAVAGSEVLGRGELSLGFTGSLMSRPLVLANILTGEEVSTPVRIRLGYELVAAWGLTRSLQFGIALPVVAAQDGDRLQSIDLDETSLAAVALGDLRLHGKARLVGDHGGGGSVAVAMALTIPSGDDEHFAGEAGALIEWRLIGAWRWPGRARLAANLGPRLRTQEVVLLSPARPHGNELVAAAAGELTVPGLAHDQLSALLEYAVAIGDSATSVRGPSPGELRAGLRWRFATGVTITVGAGLGTTPDEIGSPAWRAIVAVRYDSAPHSDLDRDGFDDSEDLCRLRGEDFDGFADFDGCPEPDNDGDGIADADDECPNAGEDFDRYRDLDGCPEDGP